VPAALPPFALAEAMAGGATILDIRPGADFIAHHAPGALGIPYSKAFSTYAGSVIPFGSTIYLLAESATHANVARAARDLAFIGYDHVVGAFGADALSALAESGRALARVHEVAPAEALAEAQRGTATIVDVRTSTEFAEGHVPGATLVPLPQLVARMAEVPKDRPVVLHCQGGTRSLVALSLLEAHGWTNLRNLPGGMNAWQAAGLPVEAGVPAGVA
jgi:hydroxyacylglutathione hydrolase